MVTGGARPVYRRSMRVEVNTELCQGHNRCYALAPELFDVDDYGTAVVIGDGVVTPELEAKAQLAVANCPEYAISIVEEDA
jgi:ferredoxin